MAQNLHPKVAEMRAMARMNTVGFESGGMPKRMQGTKANSMDDYKSRFETLGLGTGGSSASAATLQSKARAFAEKALALGEAAGLGGARVPLVADAAKTIEQMMDKFVTSKVARHQGSEVARQAQKKHRSDKKDGKDKKKDKKKKSKKKERKKSKKHEKAKKKAKKKKKKGKGKEKGKDKEKDKEKDKKRKRAKEDEASSGSSSSSSSSADSSGSGSS
eukprot:CAMPEP_0171242618 /NCGR_PEP_ID=MMETSP0790-20130122/45805_1 /TAXON_ID=2925 /ORGANISM="Alexandrium catenella, Strain OF101" /LENGTH=217 /DNA_ID=CAMNT_0011709467 /DNA_START=16 /DNA_END=666 /DNA_ORIENTATION=-